MKESPGESFIEADRRGDAVTLIAYYYVVDASIIEHWGPRVVNPARTNSLKHKGAGTALSLSLSSPLPRQAPF